MLATHALLGTPADDAELEEIYTQITKKGIYKVKRVFSLAFGADSLSDTAPLRELIAKFITADTYISPFRPERRPQTILPPGRCGNGHE